MDEKEISVEELVDEINALLQEPEEPAPEEAPKKAKKAPSTKLRTFGRGLAKIGIALLTTVALLVAALYGVMYVLAKGPSPTARDLFVRSVRETSAIGFLANLYFSEAEIQEIIQGKDVAEYIETDTSLIQIPQPEQDTDENQGPVADQWGLIDEDGDGIIVQDVKGQGYSGKMMIVLDPSRVIMGSVPSSYGYRGYTVAEMVAHFDAVAGINAGGFEDPNGNGNGSIPDTMVVYEGKIYYAASGVSMGFVGFDENHIMHVGKPSVNDITEKKIQYGVCFGPVLVSNGQVHNPEQLVSGVNPRTAIGQRSDGAILLLVIDGRQVSSLGATYMDLAEIFLSYGAVNACNLDGGSSSVMWFEGDYINSPSTFVGIRPVPTTFLVLKQGDENNG
jgi:exopolysaccharide biosynthesis protein